MPRCSPPMRHRGGDVASSSPPRQSVLLEGDGRIAAFDDLGVVEAGDLKASVDLALEPQTGLQLLLGNIEPVAFHGWPGEEAGENARSEERRVGKECRSRWS